MENNNNFINKITTSGITLFDENGTMLRLGYLDDSLSLVIGEPRLADNGKKTYPQDARHAFIITMDRANAFYQNILMDKALSAIENGRDYSGGIFLNKRKDAIFEVRIQQGDIYFIYHKDIKEDRTPTNSYVFKCQKTSIVEGYNPNGSEFSQSEVEGVFMVICKYFESGIFDVHNSATHAFRKGNAYTTNAIFNYLKGISAKLGVTIGNGYSNNRSGSYDNPEHEELPFNDEPQSASSLADLLG